MIYITLLTLMVLFICWLVRGRDTEKPAVTLEMYPPEGIDPMQMEFLIRGSLTTRSLYAMLLYWVSKGYLKLINNDGKYGVHLITSLPETAAKYAHRLFDRLFRNRKQIWFDSMPKDWDVNHMLTRETKKSVGYVFSRERIVYHRCLFFYMAAWFVVFIMMFIRIFATVEMPAVIFAIIMAPLMLCVYNAVEYLRSFTVFSLRSERSLKSLIFFIIFTILPLFAIFKQTSGLSLISAIILLYGGIFLCSIMEKRENVELYGKILGFREFIETSEYDKLKTLQKDDPTYGMDILPYAIIFNLGTEWSKKCELDVKFGN